MNDTIVFDVETKKSFEDVGGRDNLHLLGVSVVAAYSYEKDKFFAFDESKINHFEEMVKNSKMIIGFNIKGFDIPVLNAYFNFGNGDAAVLDLMDDVKKGAGFRISLDNIAKNTLGVSKSADGLQALKWYKEGKIDEIKKYCVQDVKVTKEVYEFGKKNGHVLYFSRDSLGKTAIPVFWGSVLQKDARQVLKEAFEKRKTVKIDYITGNLKAKTAEARNTRLVDIYKLNNNFMEGYCHLRKEKRIFRKDRILKAEMTNRDYQIHEDVQGSLL